MRFKEIASFCLCANTLHIMGWSTGKPGFYLKGSVDTAVDFLYKDVRSLLYYQKYWHIKDLVREGRGGEGGGLSIRELTHIFKEGDSPLLAVGRFTGEPLYNYQPREQVHCRELASLRLTSTVCLLYASVSLMHTEREVL